MAGNPNGVEELYSVLRKRILDEVYYPGEKLSENALAKEFSCSRTPIRESLKRLEQDGLIVVRPQSGTYVRLHSGKDYRDLIEVRAYLEGLSYRLAVERGADVSGLEAAVEEMDRALAKTPMDMVAYAESHFKFHREFVSLSGNDLLAQFFDRLNLKSSHLFIQSMNIESARKTQDEHRRIVELVRLRDQKGEKFIISHLWRKRDFLGY